MERKNVQIRKDFDEELKNIRKMHNKEMERITESNANIVTVKKPSSSSRSPSILKPRRRQNMTDNDTTHSELFPMDQQALDQLKIIDDIYEVGDTVRAINLFQTND